MTVDDTGPWTTFTPHDSTDIEYEYVFVQAPYEAAVAWFEAAFGRNPLAAVYQGDSTELSDSRSGSATVATATQYVAPTQSHESFEDARRVTGGEREAAAIGRTTSRPLTTREITVDQDCMVVEHVTFDQAAEERDGYTNPRERVVLDGQGRPVFDGQAYEVSVKRPGVGEPGEIERTTAEPESGEPPTTSTGQGSGETQDADTDESQDSQVPELQTVERELLENMSYRDLQQAAGDFDSISGTLSKEEFVEAFSGMGLARFSEAVENTDAEFPSTEVAGAVDTDV